MFRFCRSSASVIAGLLRSLRLTSQKKALAALVMGLVELAKSNGKLPNSFSTRSFQRKVNFNNLSTINKIKEIVNTAKSGNMHPLIRPFSINIQRVINIRRV